MTPASYLGYHLLHVGSYLVFRESAATLGESHQVAAYVESVHFIAQRRHHPPHVHGSATPAAVPGHEQDRRTSLSRPLRGDVEEMLCLPSEDKGLTHSLPGFQRAGGQPRSQKRSRGMKQILGF